MLLAKVSQEEIDNLIVKICEIYQTDAEPYFLAGACFIVSSLRDKSLLGIGILESPQAIPCL